MWNKNIETVFFFRVTPCMNIFVNRIEILYIHNLNMLLTRYDYWWALLLIHQLLLYYRVIAAIHDDVIKWKHFPRYWSFVRGIHRSPVNSPRKGQ